MVERIAQEELVRIAAVTDAPALTKVDRNFGLPTGLLYHDGCGLSCLFGSHGGRNDESGSCHSHGRLRAIYRSCIGVPTVWVTMKPDADGGPLTLGQFRNRGIETLSGRLTASEASLQVLILPVLILAWGVTVAVIIALT